jgi:hypothetical protein
MTIETTPSKKQLHTDRLEARFGPVRAQIHEHTDSRRVIDIVDETGVSRTHAVTWFDNPNPVGMLAPAREKIRNGALLGKTIRDEGYDIEKAVLEEGIVEIPGWLADRFFTDADETEYKVYKFICHDGEHSETFGIVCELYSPEMLQGSTLVDNRENDTFRNRLIEYLNEATT